MIARQRYSPYIEINLDNLIHNLELIRAKTAPHPIMAVVKDRAYGCGAAPIARALENHGVSLFAVARAREARHLRNEGITSPILLLGEAGDDDLLWGSNNTIHFALNDLHECHRWASLGKSIVFHCNLDTGMGRLGIRPEELDSVIRVLQQSPHLHMEGILTHFSSADEPHTPSVKQQLSVFEAGLQKLSSAGYSPRLIHFSNSAAALRHGLDLCNLVRPGIVLYGCKPDPTQDFGIDVREIASLRGPVIKVKKVPAGTPVSYGRRYFTSKDTWIATVHIGYAHGLPRALTNKGQLLINGIPYPIAGTVTMDYTMVDLGEETSVKPGDEAVAIGYQGQSFISADHVASLSQTIGYEILCGLSPSLNRYYLSEGNVIQFQEGFLY